MSDYKEQEYLTNVPLYGAAVYLKHLKRERDETINKMLTELL